MGPVFCRVPVIMAPGSRPGEHGPSWAVRYRHRAPARPSFTYGNKQLTNFHSLVSIVHAKYDSLFHLNQPKVQHCGFIKQPLKIINT